jgi:hypothetical protein
MPRPNVNTAPSAFSARQARCHASAKIAAFRTANHENSSKGSPDSRATRNGARKPPAIARAASACESARHASATVSAATAASATVAGSGGSTSNSRDAANVVRYRMPAPAPSSETP